jgi:hypothetical protein
MVEAKEEIIEHLLPAQEGSILREKLKRISLIDLAVFLADFFAYVSFTLMAYFTVYVWRT